MPKRKRLVLALILITLTFINCMAITAYAQPEKFTFEYTIRKDDTLYLLSQRFNTAIPEIKSLNPEAVPENLTIGNKLTITAGKGLSIYFVKKGDTLQRIAARYNSTTNIIAYKNNIDNPDLLYAGDTLAIPHNSPMRLSSLLPAKTGVRWAYDAPIELGFEMTLKQINITGTNKSYILDAELPGDPDTVTERIKYILTPASIREINPVPSRLHKIAQFDLIRAPLTVGNSWSENVRIRGAATTLTSKIKSAGTGSDGKKFFIVEYKAPLAGMLKGVYIETRTIKEGTGVTDKSDNSSEYSRYWLFKLFPM